MSHTDYCALTFNGKLFDASIPGYMTINVEGRQLFHTEYESSKIPGRDGVLITEKTYPARKLKVRFQMKGANNKDALAKLQALNLALQTKGDAVISFGDESCYYYGQLADHEDIDYDFYRGEGSFTFMCQDPYKYLPLEQYTGTSITISNAPYVKIALEELNLIPTSQSEVRITNSTSGKVISLKNLETLNAVKITHDVITQSGQNIANKLDYSVSTWKGFTFASGDNITISGASGVTLKVRRLLI